MFKNYKSFSLFSKQKQRLNISKPFIILAALLSFVVGNLLLWQLASFPPYGMSLAEKQIALTPIDLPSLVADPFFIITKFLHGLGFYFFGQGGALVTRLPSAIMGLLSVGTLMLVLKGWHGIKIAVLGCLLFAASAWTLHVSRYGSYDSSYLTAIPLLLFSQLLLQRVNARWIIYVAILIWGVLLYTPGMIWFVLLAIWWQRYELGSAWQANNGWWRKLFIIVLSLAWLPLLIVSFLHKPTLIAQWLGAPNHFGSITTIAYNAAQVPINLFISGPDNPLAWLGRLPIFDIFSTVMVVIGIIYYIKHWRSGRARQLAGYSALSIILIALGGPVSLSLIVALMYFIAAAGMSQLLREWYTRFPANPVARSIGIIILSVVVLVSCAYNLQSYFIAWPHNSATHAAFTRKFT